MADQEIYEQMARLVKHRDKANLYINRWTEERNQAEASIRELAQQMAQIPVTEWAEAPMTPVAEAPAPA